MQVLPRPHGTVSASHSHSIIAQMGVPSLILLPGTSPAPDQVAASFSTDMSYGSGKYVGTGRGFNITTMEFVKIFTLYCRRCGARTCRAGVPIKAPLERHPSTSRAPSVHPQGTVSAPSGRHQCTISAPSVHLKSTISAPSVRRQCTSRAPSVHHQCAIGAPSVHLGVPIGAPTGQSYLHKQRH